MQVGRINAGDKAIMVLNVDDNVPDSAMEEIRGDAGDLYCNVCTDILREDLRMNFFRYPYR